MSWIVQYTDFNWQEARLFQLSSGRLRQVWWDDFLHERSTNFNCENILRMRGKMKSPVRECSVRTLEKIDATRRSASDNPMTFLHHRSQQLGMSSGRLTRGTDRRAKKWRNKNSCNYCDSYASFDLMWSLCALCDFVLYRLHASSRAFFSFMIIL